MHVSPSMEMGPQYKQVLAAYPLMTLHMIGAIH
jgi:hypothetical protein